tara:strand:- start:9730 stop:9945 length:216 start_codon:yes stop_codon:yes gene_type:complete
MTYTEKDIGSEVQITIEDVLVWDEVIEMFLPNGNKIIGPSITCGHIYARFVMIPDMIRISDSVKKHLEELE